MNLLWDEKAWGDYLWWQTHDKKTLKKINDLVKEILRNQNKGIGKPEPLKADMSGWWSRRIDKANRLVYKKKDNAIIIASCRGHYDDQKLYPDEIFTPIRDGDDTYSLDEDCIKRLKWSFHLSPFIHTGFSAHYSIVT